MVCYGDGSNIVPTISLSDLTNIVVEIVETLPEKHYVFAVDDSKNSLIQIIKTISESLGTGKVLKVGKEQALTNKKLTQLDIDLLQTNLRLEAAAIKDMGFEWKYEVRLIMIEG